MAPQQMIERKTVNQEDGNVVDHFTRLVFINCCDSMRLLSARKLAANNE